MPNELTRKQYHSMVLARLKVEMWSALQFFEDENLEGLLALIHDLHDTANVITESLSNETQETIKAIETRIGKI